jgi:predicted unusual protein kinase regulating ubiquinone biosynthesis (AarF/ABC1/UbiB family)
VSVAPPPALRALLEATASLARTAPSAQLALATLHALVDPAVVPHAVRGPVVAALDRAEARAPGPLGAREVERLLRAAWGRPPARVLDAMELDRPLRAGPLGQVHDARLEGEAVTVEVRRPGLERTVRGDLALLDGLAAPLGAAFPALDAGAWLRALRAQALDELDLEHAAGLQRRVRRALRDVPGVVVPAVHSELATPDVLVAERLDGPTLAQERPADAASVARALVGAHVAAARAGIVPVDARPEHVVLLADDGIGLLGTGAAAPVRPERVDGLLAALGAVRDDDPAALGRALADLGLLDARDAPDALALAREVLGELADGPARLDAGLLAAAGGRALDALPALFALARRAAALAEDAPPARALGQLALVLARLEASEDWARLAATRAPGPAGRRPARSARRRG